MNPVITNNFKNFIRLISGPKDRFKKMLTLFAFSKPTRKYILSYTFKNSKQYVFSFLKKFQHYAIPSL